MDATGNKMDMLNGKTDTLNGEDVIIPEEDVNSIRSREARMRALFDKINFTTLGAEADYKELFSNTVYQLYKQIDEELTKLAQHMAEEIESTYGVG